MNSRDLGSWIGVQPKPYLNHSGHVIIPNSVNELKCSPKLTHLQRVEVFWHGSKTNIQTGRERNVYPHLSGFLVFLTGFLWAIGNSSFQWFLTTGTSANAGLSVSSSGESRRSITSIRSWCFFRAIRSVHHGSTALNETTQFVCVGSDRLL